MDKQKQAENVLVEIKKLLDEAGLEFQVVPNYNINIVAKKVEQLVQSAPKEEVKITDAETK